MSEWCAVSLTTFFGLWQSSKHKHAVLRAWQQKASRKASLTEFMNARRVQTQRTWLQTWRGHLQHKQAQQKFADRQKVVRLFSCWRYDSVFVFCLSCIGMMGIIFEVRDCRDAKLGIRPVVATVCLYIHMVNTCCQCAKFLATLILHCLKNSHHTNLSCLGLPTAGRPLHTETMLRLSAGQAVVSAVLSRPI